MKSDINNKINNPEPRQPINTRTPVSQQNKVSGQTSQSQTKTPIEVTSQTNLSHDKAPLAQVEADNVAKSSKEAANQYHSNSRTNVTQQKVERNQTDLQNSDSKTGVGFQLRHAQIAKRAYEIYEQSGQADGNSETNWLQAENENKNRKQ